MSVAKLNSISLCEVMNCLLKISLVFLIEIYEMCLDLKVNSYGLAAKCDAEKVISE